MSPSRIGWILLCTLCFSFALLALQYPVAFFVEGTPQLWTLLLEAITGADYARGPGSMAAEQSAHHQANRWVLLVHIVAGALTLGLSPLQFSERLRIRFPRSYRRLVLAVFILGGTSMTGALLYLLGSNASTVFAGPIFMAQCWGMLVLYMGVSGVALLASQWQRPVAHRAWAALAFALLLTAPMLRVGWLFGGWLWPHITQSAMAPAIAIAVLPLGVLGAAIFVSGGQHFGPRVDPIPLWTLPAAALLFVSCVLYVPELTAGDPVARGTVTVVVMTIALLAATSTAESALARGRGDSLRAREWHGYALGMLLGCAPGGIVVAWLVAFGVHVPTATAVGASLAAVSGAVAGFVAAARLRDLFGARRALPELMHDATATIPRGIPAPAPPKTDPTFGADLQDGGVDIRDFVSNQ